MEKKRSVAGIILTVIGVVVTVAGATTDLWFKGHKPGFGPWQATAVAIGIVLLVVGGFLCARCGTCSAPKTEPPAPEPPKPA